MQLISCHDGKLHTLTAEAAGAAQEKGFVTRLADLDELAPRQVFARGAVHEILCDPAHGQPLFFAALLARAAGEDAGAAPGVGGSGAIVWCDPQGEIYPPALAGQGIPLERLFVLHPPAAADQTWAIAECLRCKGVSAVVAAPPRLSRTEARRLQLSAERGGGVGLLLRPTGPASACYAAATRWLVSPAPGERILQRWKIQLIHGHGGRTGGTVILEYSRETHLVRATHQLADRSGQEKASRPAVARAS